MEFRPDGSVLAQTALSMSRLSHEEPSRDAAETTRLVRLTLGGDSAAFEQIILRYQTRVMNLAARSNIALGIGSEHFADACGLEPLASRPTAAMP